MNSILKSAANILEELNQLNGINDAKQDGMQYTKGRLREVLKKKWKTKQCTGSTQGIWIGNLLVKKTRSSGYQKET
jgi:hypothetical protein